MQKIKFLSDMRARIQTIPTGGGGGGGGVELLLEGGSYCFSREVRTSFSSRKQMATYDFHGDPLPPLSPPISEFQTVWIHILFFIFCWAWSIHMGAQWLSGGVLDSRLKGRGFEPYRRHCVVVLEQDTFILA